MRYARPVQRAIGLMLAGGVPLLCYLATLSGASYWLDGGEFVAAAFHLGISHPPGHPLSELYGKALQLVPLGSLAARMAWGQALATAAAAALLYRAIEATVRVALTGRESVAIAAGVAGAWFAALSYGWWFQAVRPEVYALQTALVLFAIERLVAFEARASAERADRPGASGAPVPASDARPLLLAALALGLGFTNHHFMAALVVPAFLWTFLRVARRRGVRWMTNAAVLGVLTLATYVYLPARAWTNPPENPGVPTTFARLWWVVTGRVYARHQGATSWQPLDERFADMAVIVVEYSHGLFALCAVCGLYVLCRRRATRVLGVAWGAVALVGFGARAYLDPVRGNPDALGYLGPAFAATAALAVAFLAVAGAVILDAVRSPRALAPLLAALALGVGATRVDEVGSRASLAAFRATDVFGDVRVARLPPRAVVIGTTPHWVFRHWEHAAIEGERPDVTLVPLPFLAYPGTGEAFVARHPDLGAWVASYLAAGGITGDALGRLAANRPVFVELDMRLDPRLYPMLLPAHLLHRVVSEGDPGALASAARAQDAEAAAMRGRLGADMREQETSRQLLWMHYLDAVYYAGRGEIALARRSSDHAAALHHMDSHLRELRAVLGTAGSGPIDVTRFLDGERRDAAP
jgi:hypothetical protein